MIIKNGLVAALSGVTHGDIRIENGLIAEIAPSISASGHQVIDASGMVVIPGGVDAHTHMDIDVRVARASDDFYTGTAAAAIGGTTCIVDHMGFGPKGCDLMHQYDYYRGIADGKAVIDYGLHGVIQRVDDGILADMHKLTDVGVTSAKLYLTYDFRLCDEEILNFLEVAAKLGILTCVHAENHQLINRCRDICGKTGHLSPIDHSRSRPPEAEAEAVSRITWFASYIGAPLYIVHLSSALGLMQVELAKKVAGDKIFAETCPQYLFLDDSKYTDDDNGLKHIMSPPLREASNKKALWDGIINNTIDTIGTDHCPFFMHQKMMGKGDFRKAPNGAPGVETRMALIYSEGVSKNKISLERFVDLCCTRPAKLFGLFPHKGAIAPGADADVVLIDPNKRKTITKSILHENVDYTLYEGFEVTGWPVMTISRGEIIARDGHLQAEAGRGRYLRRSKPQLTK